MNDRLTETGDPLSPFYNLPAALCRMLEHVGPRWADDVPGHIARVVAGYTEVARLAPRAGYIVQRDMAYGPHPRHRLDVFTPSGAVSGDVLVFVHGGAFVRGDKTVSEALYDNVCRWFARQGVIAVNVEYRLAGDAPFPGGSEDVGAAVHWLAQHVGTLGGDASRIFLMGHSAGGTHVASYCCEPLLADAFAQGPVAGAVLVSARLRADVLPDNPNAFAVRAYYGDDAQAHEAHSPVTHARAFRVPALVAIAQYENPHLDVYGAEMMAGLLGGPLRHAHRFVQLMRHNHLSIVAHFDTGEERLGREVLDFMASVGAAA